MKRKIKKRHLAHNERRLAIENESLLAQIEQLKQDNIRLWQSVKSDKEMSRILTQIIQIVLDDVNDIFKVIRIIIVVMLILFALSVVI